MSTTLTTAQLLTIAERADAQLQSAVAAINAEMFREYEGEATRINVARLRAALYPLGATRGEICSEVRGYIEQDALKLGESMRCCRGHYNTCVARTERAERPLDGGEWLFACRAHNECVGCGKSTAWSHELCQRCESRLGPRAGACLHASGCRFITCLPVKRYSWSTYCSGHNLCRHCGCITAWAHALCSFCDPDSPTSRARALDTAMAGALIIAPAVEVGGATIQADAGHGMEERSGGSAGGPC